jgi:hypothetical protein
MVFTTAAAAAAAHWILGFLGRWRSSWERQFRHPDVVAPLAIARRMQFPKAILLMLEGEGLANAATALILSISNSGGERRRFFTSEAARELAVTLWGRADMGSYGRVSEVAPAWLGCRRPRFLVPHPGPLELNCRPHRGQEHGSADRLEDHGLPLTGTRKKRSAGSG